MQVFFSLLFFILVSTATAFCAEAPPFQEPVDTFGLFNSENTETGSPTFQDKFLRMLYVLGFLLAGMVAVLWIIKKITQPGISLPGNGKSKKNALNIIEARALSSKSNLYLVEVNEKQVLIAESHTGIAMIETPNPLEKNPL